MSRISVEAIHPQLGVAIGAEAGRKVPTPFMAFAGILILIAYLAPFQHAWTRSVTFFDLDDDRAEMTAKEGSLERQVALGTLGLIGAATLVFSKDKLQFRGPLAWTCIAYLGWCGASLLWTSDTSITFRRVVGLACEVLASIAISQRASPWQFAWLVFGCTSTWLGLGVLAEFAQNTLHPGSADYRFMGVFYPNIMAGNCVLLILSCVYLGYAMPAKKRLLQFIGGVAFVFLVLTGSRTALGTLVVLFALLVFLRASNARRLVLASGAGLLVFCVLFLSALGEFGVSTGWTSMGRSDNDVGSLTGRVPLWQELIEYASHRPLEGYGYGAFWTPRRIVDIWESQGWNPAYAHCTYIELLISVGLVGTVLFVVSISMALARAARLESRHTASGYGFVAMVMACILVDGLLETNFGATSFMSFFGVCAVCFALSAPPARRQSFAHATLNGRSH